MLYNINKRTMPKVGGEINKNFYKYAVKQYDNFNNIIHIQFFMTQSELIEKYKMSRMTLQRYFKDHKRIKKFKDCEFEKVRVPVYKRVVNDVFTHHYFQTDCSEYESDSGEIDYIEDLPNGKKHLIYEPN